MPAENALIAAALRDAFTQGLATALSGEWRYIDESDPEAGVTNGRALMSLRAFRDLCAQTEAEHAG